MKDLKAELKDRGLSRAGLKADLVVRLEEADKKAAPAEEVVEPVVEEAVEEAPIDKPMNRVELIQYKLENETEWSELQGQLKATKDSSEKALIRDKMRVLESEMESEAVVPVKEKGFDYSTLIEEAPVVEEEKAPIDYDKMSNVEQLEFSQKNLKKDLKKSQGCI